MGEAIGEKTGKGGSGLQGYDSEGKYTAKSGITKEQALGWIESNQEYKAIYDSLDDSTKEEMIKAVMDAVDESYTSSKMAEEFPTVSRDEYIDIANSHKAELEAIYGQDEAARIQDAFYRGYRGAGQYCFNFNKCLRLGYDKAYDWYVNNGGYGAFPTRDAVEEKADALQKLASTTKMPRDARVIRYVDENWVVNAFRPLVEKLGIVPDDGYGYETLDRNAVSVSDIVNALSSAKGARLDGDKGFTSFSVAGSLSHMARKVSAGDYKRILIRYDVPKGTKCFVSTYERESEGLFPRGTNYYVKDVQSEVGDDGNERAVLTIGIR